MESRDELSSQSESEESALAGRLSVPDGQAAGNPPGQGELEEITRAFGSITQFTAPIFNPIFQQVNSEHISQIIDHEEKHDVRAFADAKSRRWFYAGFGVLTAAVIISLVVFFILTDHEAMVNQVLTTVALVFGGVGLGQLFFRR